MEEDEDFEDLFKDWDSPEDEIPDEGLPGERVLNEKEVTIVGVFEHGPAAGGGTETFVLLQDREERKVPIWIGRFEAIAISTALDGTQLDRPMTHDLIRILLERIGATVDQVIVDDLFEGTYYAKLYITLNDRSYEIDCRPSDAIAIAVRTKAPIYVAESVFRSVERPD